jgi:hypothetical protein
MMTPNAHTLLLGNAVYASMPVLHVLYGQRSQVGFGHIGPLMAQQFVAPPGAGQLIQLGDKGGIDPMTPDLICMYAKSCFN